MSSEPSRPAPSFQRENLLLQALLLFVTLGLYMLWWLYRQTQVINAHLPASAIPAWLVHTAMISVPAFMIIRLSYGVDMPTEPSAPLMVSNMLALGSLVGWLLLVRRGINELSQAKMGDSHWISLPLTLLLTLVQLSPVYMQFVINRVLDARGRP